MNNFRRYWGRERGFTLIELLVAMTIAAILMAFALPSFNDFTTQRHMSANANVLISAITYARSEATRVGGMVTLQSVDGSEANNEWGAGFCVVMGEPGDCHSALKYFYLDGDVTLDAVDGLQMVAALSFNSRGMLMAGRSGSVQLCGQDAGDDPGRVVNVNVVGRTHVAQLTCYP